MEKNAHFGSYFVKSNSYKPNIMKCLLLSPWNAGPQAALAYGHIQAVTVRSHHKASPLGGMHLLTALVFVSPSRCHLSLFHILPLTP